MKTPPRSFWLLSLALLAFLFCFAPATARAQTAGQRAPVDPRTGERLPGLHAEGNLTPGPRQPGTLEGQDASSSQQQPINLRAYLREGETGLARVSSTTLYATDGTLFKSFDVSDPTDPQLLDTLAIPALGSDAVVSGGRVYLADDTGGLRIIDVSDPSSLQELGALENLDALGIALDGDYAYVSNGPDGTAVVDVSDPANPTEVSTIPSSGSSNGLDVDAANDVLYIAGGTGGLRIADVSDPNNPSTLGTFAASAFVTFATYENGTAYLTGGFGVAAIDVSDPANPDSVGGYTPPSGDTAFEVTVEGGTAYVAAGQSTFYTLDVSTPSSISLLGTFDQSDGSGLSLDVSGDDVFLAERFTGLRVLDVSDAGNPAEEAFVPGGGFSFFADIEDDIAYVTDIFGRLRIIDLSDPDDPQEISRVTSLPPNTQRVEVRNGLAYVADADFGPTGLSIVDVSDPNDPQVLSTLDTGGQATGIALDGDVAVLANGFGGVVTADISDPNNPTLLGTYTDVFGNFVAVDISGGVAYAVSFGGGLAAVDISDPNNPTTAGTFAPGGNTNFMNDIEIVADTAYLATGAGLNIVDVANPANISSLGSAATPTTGPRSVSVVGDEAYLAIDFVGVRQYDVSDATSPTEIDFLPSADRTLGLGEERGLLIATAGGGGAYVLGSQTPRTAFFNLDGSNNLLGPGRNAGSSAYTATAQVRANDDEGIGDATLVFTYDPANLMYEDGITRFLNGFGEGCYSASTITRPTPGEVVIDLDYALGDPGCAAGEGKHLSKAFTDVARICFGILDTSATSNLTWDMAQTQVFVDDAAGTMYQNGGFTGASDALPVELASFEATASGGEQVTLSWQTASETANDGFLVQRRRSNTDVGATGRSPEWRRVAFIESKAPGGTATEALDYRFTDAELPFEAQALTYRLIQRDLDGNTRPVGEPQTVELGAPQAFALAAPAPNPVREAATLRYTLPERRAVTVKVFDALGRTVRTLVDERQAGRQEARFEVGGLSSGVYFVRLVAGDFAATQQIVVVR